MTASLTEKKAIILDQTVGAIGTGSATVHQKAALSNRLSVLMEVADRVDRGGFYDRMAVVMFTHPTQEGRSCLN